MPQNGRSEKTKKSIVSCRFCGQEFIDKDSGANFSAMSQLEKHIWSSPTCRKQAKKALHISKKQLDDKYGGYPGAYQDYLDSLVRMTKE